MTQTEYENLKLHTDDPFPKRTPIGVVVISNFETWKHATMWAGELVETRYYTLTLWDKPYGPYRTKPGSRVLYTMDEHGNIKSPSVFREPDTQEVKNEV